ncbi:TIGR00730 family Rossman fold protein [Enterococcus faecalis]|nr:TIGR00730 family Rossman fold protein [Listeria monocytogenes]EAC9420084.1 TIGR00730 family Rossman fold protein [Listeria monocytogenes]EAC9438472.1 TIGR00730 family Rossman fold protein [Listeria monocytogenes]KAJ73243.1 Lysine decarboxylase family [Enterococcus faecalis MD6]MBO6323866.1 TIGR00730 family Rossman fold protein [Enterococcus faecalis]
MFVKKMAVYCGASLGNEPIYQQAAVALAAWMKENHYDLVYGGGNIGLMGTVADTLLAEGGEVIGVMPTFLMEREIAHNGITKMHTVSDMHARKKKMIELADVYLALPGGPGTLEEISEVISWGRVGEHMNPCILYNVNGYYDLLAAFFDKMVETNFLTAADRAKIFISDSLEEIGAFIDSYEPPMIRQYKK